MINPMYPVVEPGVRFINDQQEVVAVPGGKAGILPAGYEREVTIVDGDRTKVKASHAYDADGFWLMTSSVAYLIRIGRVIE